MANAIGKLTSKNVDLIVLNSLNDPGAAFGHDTNRVTILHRAGNSQRFGLKAKRDVARDIVNAVTEQLDSQIWANPSV